MGLETAVERGFERSSVNTPRVPTLASPGRSRLKNDPWGDSALHLRSYIAPLKKKVAMYYKRV